MLFVEFFKNNSYSLCLCLSLCLYLSPPSLSPKIEWSFHADGSFFSGLPGHGWGVPWPSGHAGGSDHPGDRAVPGTLLHRLLPLWREGQCPNSPSDSVVLRTDFVVTVGQTECIVSDRNLACTILIRHETLSDGEVNVCPLLKGPGSPSDSIVGTGRNS